MPTKLDVIKKQLSLIENEMLTVEEKKRAFLHQVHADHYHAAKNLIHYLVLRKEDRRLLQELLHENGLSSLASSESHVRRQLQAINERLGKTYPKSDMDVCSYVFGQLKMKEKSRLLFGSKTTAHIPSIMVTFDSDCAWDYELIKSLLENGMNVARINCAHDDEAIWDAMIQNLKKACTETGLECKIYMDLAGPKIRTKLLGRGKNKGKVKVKEGHLIWLAEDDKPYNKKEVVISPTERGIISCLKTGDRVFIDDGIICGIVEKTKKHKASIRIEKIFSKKKLIKEKKGINFPDTKLEITSLTAFDKSCLPFICEHADLIGYSFVKTPEDMERLRDAMKAISSKHPHIIIKIETLLSVENLPSLLLEGMKDAAMGVMIARGDLAVEIGFERMGEIQDEILWICEAAHVPVIWATQVLENLHKSGMATRSEITDAGHAAMAECIMINKGKHTIEVMNSLKDIIQRASSHRIKKRFTFRPLQIAKRYFGQDIP